MVRPRKLDPALALSLKRPPPARGKRKAILIALEDAASARLYFESFRRALRKERVVVIAPHTGSAPRSVVEAAKLARDAREQQAEKDLEDRFDEVWVVFDTEGPQNDQRRREARSAIDQARQLDFKTAVSNPSFEYWLLLHFVWWVQPILSGRHACRLLEKHVPRYHKGMDCFDITFPNVHEAIGRSRRVFTERCKEPRDHPCDCHPCTQIHLLADSLLSDS